MEDMSSYSEGQTHQLMDSLEAAGYTPTQVTALGQNFNGALNQLLLVLTGEAKVVANLVFRLVAKIDRDMKGWECLEPVEAEESEFEPSIHEFLEENDGGSCGCEEMIKRARKDGISSGIRHLEAMLREQEKIPVEWRRFVLVSTEVWQSPDGYRYVWYLCWDGERWSLRYYWLGYDFYSRYRLVRLPQVSKTELGSLKSCPSIWRIGFLNPWKTRPLSNFARGLHKFKHILDSTVV
jgi:hypothetical protein